ncbi:MAG TPA: hypothetical protein VF852_12345, partial [Pseudolabrys sp.]
SVVFLMTKRVHHPIAFCPDHGVFPAKAVALATGASIRFENCGTNCPSPNCNRTCEIISGLSIT